MNAFSFPTSSLFEDACGFAKRCLKPCLENNSSHKGEQNLRSEDWKRLGEFGVFRLPFNPEDGGLGMSSSELCDVWEGLGAGSQNTGLLFASGAHLWAVLKPIVDLGTDAQKQRWLEGLYSGELVGAHAASEADSGSDVMAMKTQYRRVEDGFILKGGKTWITNAPIADVFLVFATCNPQLHFRGVSAFLVPADTAGLAVTPLGAKMGLSGASMGTVYFDNCFLPSDALLGKERQAQKIFQSSLTWERALILSPAVGAARRQILKVIDYANQRRQFGQAIGRFQAVSHRVVDMYTAYWQARQLLRKCAYELMHKQNDALASVAKLVLSDLANTVHLKAFMSFGGAAYLQETGIECDIRDALGALLYSGTSDIQKNIIARNIGL